MGVHNCPFDVVQISVVLQGTLQQTSLLTQLSNRCSVVVVEHLVTQDCVRNLQIQISL